MKNLFLTILIFFIANLSFGQVILESNDGVEIATYVSDSIGDKPNFIGVLNTGDQNFQLKAILGKKTPGNFGSQLESFYAIGLKGKPSDGIATLFSKGNFNPSTSLDFMYGKSYIFSQNPGSSTTLTSGFTDYILVKGEYSVNKYTIFNPDTNFSKQFSNPTFQGTSIHLSYNAFTNGKNLFNVSVGYSQRNNYSSLSSVEIKDFKSEFDNVSNTTRQYGKTVNGKIGEYKEYECFPMKLSYTYCPDEAFVDKSKIKLGISIYYSSEFAKSKRPLHNVGSILFLTKANEKSGFRTPILGLGIQANDLNDSQNSSSFLTKRISFNLTTVWNFNSI